MANFDSVISPLLTSLIQRQTGGSDHVLLTFSNWRWLIFGIALIVMMRVRPEGLWPSSRVAAEMHHGEDDK